MSISRPPAATAAILAVLVLLAVPAGDATAHGGRRVLQTTAGPYRIEATISRAGDLVDETVTAEETTGERPASGATVLLLLDEAAGQTAGPFVASPAGAGYEARYPAPGDGRWTVRIEIRARLGDATVSHPYRAPPGGVWTGRTAVLINALVIVTLVAAVFVLPRFGRRTRGPARRGEEAARS